MTATGRDGDAIGDPESHAAELGRLNAELTQVAVRATKLLEVTAAPSQASSVEEVSGVVLERGLAVVEASRGLLICTENDRVEVLGGRGYSRRIADVIRTYGRAADLAIMEAMRTGGQGSAQHASPAYPDSQTSAGFV